MEKEKWERKREIVKKIQSKREKDCKEKSERKIVKKLGECERNKKEKGRKKENKEKEDEECEEREREILKKRIRERL